MTATLHAPAPPPASLITAPSRVAPMGAVLAVTFINSVATGIPYNGIWYITKNVYGFSATANFALGVLLGVTYVFGALATGPIVRRLKARGVAKGERDVLLGLTLIMTVMAALPLSMFFFMSPETRPQGAWSIWVYMGVYSTLCGGFWPIVESFLSGGRTASELRGAIGKFNITWSSSLILSLWCLVPFNVTQQVFALGVGSLLHIVSLYWLMRLPREPGEHPHETHEVPAIYRVLLPVHRVLLPMAYLVMYALSPLLPSLLDALAVGARWQPAVASAWLAARVGMFTLLERWHGWHGRWITATAGTVLLLGGFTLAILSPEIAAGTMGVVVLVIGLLLFGAGAAAVYCGALYYGLEVGAAEVEAGGMHEAMIGVGYTLGPASGLLPAWLVATNTLQGEWQHRVMLGLVGVMTAGGITFALAVKRRASRLHLPGRNPNGPS